MNPPTEDGAPAGTWQCRATSHGERCDYEGTREQLTEHAATEGHPTCVLCGITLNEFEQQTCSIRIGKESRATCVEKLDAALADIHDAYATLPTIVEHSGYYQAALPGGNALVMLVDGSTQGGGPDDHVKFRDPPPALAELYRHERDWAEILNQPREARGDATVTSTITWLRRWLPVVARRHDAFADVAAELRDLRSKLQHTAGIADDPESAPAECFDCGGRLRRPFRPLRATVDQRLEHAAAVIRDDDSRITKHVNAQIKKHPDQPELHKHLRVPARTTRVRHAVAGDDREGRSDTWICASCKRTYDKTEYGLALRMRANSISGWVTVRIAAETLRRPEQTLWRWVRELDVASACSVFTRRVLVEWEQTKQRSEDVQRRNHDRDEPEEVAS